MRFLSRGTIQLTRYSISCSKKKESCGNDVHYLKPILYKYRQNRSDENKLIIYQVFTRLFGNDNNHCVNNANIAVNGCGKMKHFTPKALKEIKKLGTTHIWYTGIIEHATQTDYRQNKIQLDIPPL